MDILIANVLLTQVSIGDSVTQANPEVADLLKGLFGIVVDPTVAVGLTCSPLKAIGLSSGTW